MKTALGAGRYIQRRSQPRLQSEALMLTWDNVDLKNGFLTVQDAYAKSGRTRTVPLDSGLSEALSRLKEEAKGQYVFAKAEGNPYRSIRTAFDTACRNAKLSDVTGPHVLRHTLVSPWNGWSRRSYHSRVGWLEELKDG